MDLEDRLAIIDLVHRYGHVFDEGRLEGLDDLFTAEATFAFPRADAETLELHGRSAIVEHMRARYAATSAGQRRHLTSNVVVDDAGPRRATAAAYLLVASTTGGALSLQATGRYTDHLERGEDGSWRFARRVLTLDGPIA